MKKFLLQCLVILVALQTVNIARGLVTVRPAVDCTAASAYACIKMPGSNSGYAILLVKPDAGNAELTLPTESGDLLTEQQARRLFAPLVPPTPTPLPTPTPTSLPTPTPTPVPTPVPTPNPVTISPPSFPITELFGVSDVNLTKFNVTAPGPWIASTSTPWLALHCATGGCGGSFFYVQIKSSAMARGLYSGAVTVKSGSATATLPVTLVVQ